MAGSPDPEVGRPDPTAALLPLPSLLTDPVGRGGEAGQASGEAGPTPRQQRRCASAAADSGPVRPSLINRHGHWIAAANQRFTIILAPRRLGLLVSNLFLTASVKFNVVVEVYFMLLAFSI